jgi:hypothetical protein
MKSQQEWLIGVMLGTLMAWPLALSAAPASEVPAGTRFMVELRDKLDAKKIKEGKKFKAETLEALRASDGSIIPAGAKLKGRVSFVEYNKMVLRFERIESKVGKMPIVASATGVVGEKGIQREVGNEGEIKAAKSRGRATAAGAVIGAGVGAAVGASQGGKKGAAIGTGVGAAAGGVLGAIIGTTDLVLQKGTRIELELERPLTFEPRR